MDQKLDNLDFYGCLFIFFVGCVLFSIDLAYFLAPYPWESWFLRIYVVLNLSVLHIVAGLGINDSLNNPKRQTYKTKGIRYKVDKVDRIIRTTFGIWLWIMIFCLDVWSIASGNDMLWQLYHTIRLLITIPLAVLWAVCIVEDFKEKADREEKVGNED